VSTIDTDLCIVGSGAAGGTVARELARSPLRVLLVEAGGADPAAAPEVPIEVTGLPIGPESRRRALGGTTTTWWGKVATLDAIDLRTRPWIPRSGWPFDRADLEPYYQRAARLLGLPALASADREAVAPLRGPTLEGADLRATHLFWQRPPLDFSDLHRREVAPARNVTTLLDAEVTALHLDRARGAVESLTVLTAADGELSVRARAVVLAAGGIENARLLLASGVGNEHDQVGRCFMEHPKGVCGEVVLSGGESPLLDRSYWRGQRAGGVQIQRGVGLTEAAQEREGTLNPYLMLEPVHGAKGRPGMEALRRLYRRRGFGPADVGRVLRDLPAVAGALGFRVLNRGRLDRLRIHNFLEQAPHPSNRVTLSDQRDRFGGPLARLAWSITDLDRHSIGALHRALDREVRRRGWGRVESPLLDDGEWLITQDASHHAGTTRMGVDPRSSVVDPDTRVHSVRNLFVAGSSVFPTSGYANPTFTIVALALRLADHLQGVLRPPG
jgi:choline dehydrogenase-like flavoprotein